MRALIVNPFASGVTRGEARSRAGGAPGRTRRRLLTAARGDATDLAAEWSPQAEAIYVFSGDGTYNEVLNGLRARRPVGFLPGGGTSVLPRALGLAARSGARRRADPLRQAAAHLAGADQRAAVRLQRGHRARRRARAAGRRTRPPGGREAAGRLRLRPGRAEGAGASGASAIRSRSRSKASGGRRSRSSRTARRTPTPGGSGCASRRTRPSRAASTSSRRVDVRAARIPRLAVAGAARPPARRATRSSATTSTGS